MILMGTRFCTLLLLLLPAFLPAQSTVRYDLPRLLREDQLTVVHRLAAADSGEGRQFLTLNEETDEGLVWLNGVSFRTGTIDVELKGQDVFQRSFIGIAFHGENDSTFEAVDAMLEKRLVGFGEIFRLLTYQDIGSPAIMSRATD
ncbi:MAG: hypothetical protein HUU02_17165, partial [Bacteroidetes bacterium]|nr:hypothetical protein [Bacteroidota bacterium]